MDKFISMVTGASRIVIVVSFIYIAGVAGFILASLTLGPLIGVVLILAFHAFIVIFILYQLRGVIGLWLGLGNPDAKLSDQDVDQARKDLEQDNEKIYTAPVEDAVKFIDDRMRDYADDLGYDNLNDRFGHYQELSGLLTRVKWQIENSRQSGDQGDALRRNIAASADFKALLNYFDELRSSIMAIRVSIAQKEAELSERSLRWWIIIFLAVSAFVVASFSIILN